MNICAAIIAAFTFVARSKGGTFNLLRMLLLASSLIVSALVNSPLQAQIWTAALSPPATGSDGCSLAMLEIVQTYGYPSDHQICENDGKWATMTTYNICGTATCRFRYGYAWLEDCSTGSVLTSTGCNKPRLDNGPGCPKPVGDPVDPLRGLSEQYLEDWSSGGPNPLTIGRFYYKNDGFNSSANNSSAFGYGWRPSFQAMLAASDASFTNVVVTVPCGRELLFILTGGTFQPAYIDAATGNYVAGAKGMAETLIDTGTKLELTTNDGVIYAFDKTSRLLVQVRKRGGYIQTPTYDADGKLTGLQDNLGRSAVFQHDNQGRITSVFVDSMTVVVYAYSSIVDPSLYAGLPLPIPPDLVMSAAVLSNVSYPSIDCVP
jgi:hypothetical protein